MKKDDVTQNELLSIAEAAEVLGYTRQHVLRLVKSGDIKASRAGRSFYIRRADLPGPFSDMTKQEKATVDRAVDRVYKYYGDTIRKLGEE